jgi:hypothetical protein
MKTKRTNAAQEPSHDEQAGVPPLVAGQAFGDQLDILDQLIDLLVRIDVIVVG